jgi:hypothetical protein
MTEQETPSGVTGGGFVERSAQSLDSPPRANWPGKGPTKEVSHDAPPA